MALKISTQNPYDGTASEAYFKIVETNINWLNRSSHITLVGWVDRQARLDGKQPIISRSYDWSGEDFPFDFEELDEEGMNTVKIAYDKIKSLKTVDEEGNEVDGEFTNAVEC